MHNFKPIVALNLILYILKKYPLQIIVALTYRDPREIPNNEMGIDLSNDNKISLLIKPMVFFNQRLIINLWFVYRRLSMKIKLRDIIF